MKNIFFANVFVTLFIVVLSFIVYDHQVVRPSQQIGLIDLGEVYRSKEREFTELITKSGTEEDRQKALILAQEFAKALPVALDQLPHDCGCLVLIKSAVAGRTSNTVDITDLLKRKVGIKL